MKERVYRTLKYSTKVDDLWSAWKFAMHTIDNTDIGSWPSIEITPLRENYGIGNYLDFFEVSVSGITEVEE